jgi:hypothetical protein
MQAAEDETRRVIHFLSRGAAQVIAAARPGKVLLDGGERGRIAASARTLSDMAARGLVARTGPTLALRAEGSNRQPTDADQFQNQHRDLRTIRIDERGSSTTVAVNINESPLAQLYRRKTESSRPFLTDAEFRAGERLRADYTSASIMPRLGANWEASVSTGRRGGAGGAAELTDAVLAARQRVDKAIAGVGPELAGVLIDVCCFLKGMETVETERRWPARSAKIMLKTALGVLSRHYEPMAAMRRKSLLHWGAADFRPTIGG